MVIANRIDSVIITDDTLVYNKITVSDIKNSSIGSYNKEILLAHFTQKPIKELDANYAGEQLRTSINLTIFESGFKTENISELIIMVIRDIFSDFGHMTLAEVALAFRKGVRNEFGDIMGMSVRTFYSWLREYNEISKLEAMKSLQYLKKEEEVEISPDRKRELHMDWLKRYIADFERHKNGEPTEEYDFGNLFYNYCKKHGIGYLTKEDKDELLEKGKEAVLVNHSQSKAKNVYEARDFKKIVDAIVGSDIPKTVNEKIASEAKRLAIVKIYDKLIEQNIELSDLINEIEAEKIS